MLPEESHGGSRQSPPRVFARDGLRSYPAAIRDLQGKGRLHRGCRHRTIRYANNRIESDHRSIKRRLRAIEGPRTILTARTLIQSLEAVHMIRKGQVLGITRKNLHGASVGLRRAARRSIIPEGVAEREAAVCNRSCNTSR